MNLEVQRTAHSFNMHVFNPRLLASAPPVGAKPTCMVGLTEGLLETGSKPVRESKPLRAGWDGYHQSLSTLDSSPGLHFNERIYNVRHKTIQAFKYSVF